MAYLTATRYGLTHIEPTEAQRACGWRQVWLHPSGALAMRNPATGRWQISLDDGRSIEAGWSSSLRAASRSIERRLGKHPESVRTGEGETFGERAERLGGEARNREADREISKNAPLRERIADELAHNDECGPGPVSWQEYLADADAILRIVGEHGRQGEDHAVAVGTSEGVGILPGGFFWQRLQDAAPFPERDQHTRLIAGIQGVRGMCSDEEPYEVIDAKLAELLGLAGEPTEGADT